MKILTIWQPWAALIASGKKPVENRDWATDYRGPLAIHAGLKLTKAIYNDANTLHWDITGKTLPPQCSYQTGGIVAVVDLIDCVTEHDSSWFFGEYGLVLANPRPVEFYPFKGALGLRNLPESVVKSLHYL